MGQERIKIIKSTKLRPFPNSSNGEEQGPVPIHNAEMPRKRGRLGIVKADGEVDLPEPPTPAA